MPASFLPDISQSKPKKQRLNVLFMSSWYPTPAHPIQGIFVHEHAKAVSLVHNVVVLFNEGFFHKGNNKLLWGKAPISDLIWDNIRVLHTTPQATCSRKFSEVMAFRQRWRCLRRLLQESWKPDIIHAHVFLSAVPAVLLGKIYNIPVLVTEHWSIFPKKGLGCYLKAAAKFSLRNAQMVVPVSRSLEKAIKAHHITNKFAVVPNAVNPTIF